MRAVVLGWIAAVTAAHAADLDIPQLLGRIRTQMAQTLARLPDYTCRETIARSVQRAGSDHFQNVDLLRVDVAYLNGRELYAWPGSRFGEQNLLAMAPGGAIGTGNFGLLGKAVFAENGPVFIFEGLRGQNGRNQVRFSFRVSMPYSNYTILYGARRATVPYHGWFTADADSHDVIAFDVDANEIPRDLETLQANEHVEYVRSRIGNSEYLLPRSSETIVMGLDGAIARNQITFERCREYSGESTVTFTDRGAIPEPQPPPAASQPLRARLELRVRLMAPIEQGVTAIGDRSRAEVTKAVRRPVSIPVGSVVTLRVAGMETVIIRKKPVHVIKFELLSVHASGQSYDVGYAILERVNTPGQYAATGGGRVAVSGAELRIPAGFEMTWLNEP